MNGGPIALAGALADARAAGVGRLDAQLMLARLMAQPRSWLIAHDDAVLAPAQAAVWRDWLARRAAGEPLAYVLGEKEFHGLMLRVDARVLVPRPETEVLVDWAIELLDARSGARPARVVDLGTGSGAIALAVKHARPAVSMTATDASEAALDTARANAARLGLEVDLLGGSWWQAVGAGRFDLALGNPPYIAGDDEHLAALRHEPRQALTPEGDGLDALRAVAADAAVHLEPGGWLLMEHGYDQAEAVQRLLAAAGLSGVRTRHDLAGQPRCTGGQLAP